MGRKRIDIDGNVKIALMRLEFKSRTECLLLSIFMRVVVEKDQQEKKIDLFKSVHSELR